MASGEYWLVNGRLSQSCNQDLVGLVRKNSVRCLDRSAMHSFLGSNPKDWLVLHSLHALACMSIGYAARWALDRASARNPEQCELVLEHIIHQAGCAVSSAAKGHRHLLCWKARGVLPTLVDSLPQFDLKSITSGSKTVYLVGATGLAGLQEDIERIVG